MNEDSDPAPRATPSDPEKQLALACELFNDLSPDGFVRAVPLVEAAAASGHADAICQLATIEATGAGRPQNFERAFDLLRQAAEANSSHAQAQLRLLAGTQGNDWTAMRRLLDYPSLFAVPDKASLSDQPRIRTMAGFASAAVCDWAVARLGGKLDRALIWDETSGMGRIDPNRSNRAVEIRLTDIDVVIELLRARIAVATRLPEAIFETPQIMHYSVGQEFRPHFDFLDAKLPGPASDMQRRGQRIATFLVYLNDGFTGGETEFPRAGISYRGRKGDAIFFANVGQDGQPDPLTLHAGRPPTTGEKWIFSQWIRDRSPAAPAA